MKGCQTFQMHFNTLHQIVTKGSPGCVLWVPWNSYTWHNLTTHPTTKKKEGPGLRLNLRFQVYTTCLVVADFTLYIKQTTILALAWRDAPRDGVLHVEDTWRGERGFSLKQLVSWWGLILWPQRTVALLYVGSKCERGDRHSPCHAGRSQHWTCCPIAMLPDHVTDGNMQQP